MWSVTVRTPLGSVHRLQVEAVTQQAATSIVAEHFRRCGWYILGQREDELVVSWGQ